MARIRAPLDCSIRQPNLGASSEREQRCDGESHPACLGAPGISGRPAPHPTSDAHRLPFKSDDLCYLEVNRRRQLSAYPVVGGLGIERKGPCRPGSVSDKRPDESGVNIDAVAMTGHRPHLACQSAVGPPVLLSSHGQRWPKRELSRAYQGIGGCWDLNCCACAPEERLCFLRRNKNTLKDVGKPCLHRGAHDAILLNERQYRVRD